MMEELPWAMLAKGPAWTKTGVPSNVCIKLGLMASFISTVRAPLAPWVAKTLDISMKCTIVAEIIIELWPNAQRSPWWTFLPLSVFLFLFPFLLLHTYQILSSDRISWGVGCNYHFAKSLPHVSKGGGQGKDSHNLTGHCDVKLAFSSFVLLRGALSNGDLAQEPVICVHNCL